MSFSQYCVRCGAVSWKMGHWDPNQNVRSDGYIFMHWRRHVVFSGYATFSQDQRTLLISNLVNGIDSYAIAGVSPGLSPALVQSFRHPIRTNVPLQVTSAMQGNWVISGSDDGSVRIFDQRSGELLKSLHHSDGMRQFVSSLFYTYCLAVETLVQAVAVSESYTTYRQTTHPSPPKSYSEGERCVVVSGSTGPGPSNVKVWSYKPVGNPSCYISQFW